MKKIFNVLLVLSLCIIVIFSITGCSVSGNKSYNTNSGEKVGDNPPAGNENQGQNVDLTEMREWEGVKGRILTDSFPAEITQYLEASQKTETQRAFNIDNRTYIVLTMGQQPSAGYLIELKDLVLKEGVLQVSVKYEKPGQDDMVATVITYPSLVIETDDIYEGHYEISYRIEK